MEIIKNYYLVNYVFTKVVATLSGNSIAIIAKLAVKNAAFPIASTIRIMNDNIING